MNEFIIACLSVPTILFLWFKTGVFVEYVRLLHLGKLFKIDAYLNDKTKKVSYLPWLAMNYGQYFLVRLILCPYCLNFWLSLIASIVIWNVLAVLAIYTVSIIIYLVMMKLSS